MTRTDTLWVVDTRHPATIWDETEGVPALRLALGDRAEALGLADPEAHEHEGPVLVGSQWAADDGNAESEVEGSSAREAAQAYHAMGWGQDPSTWWLHVAVWRVGYGLEGDELVEVRVEASEQVLTIDPSEPPCQDGYEHLWAAPHSVVGGIADNPGVAVHGGGVICMEACLRCGCGLATDTWAQDPQTGEQGLRSIEYSPDEYSIEELPATGEMVREAENLDDLLSLLRRCEYPGDESLPTFGGERPDLEDVVSWDACEAIVGTTDYRMVDVS